MPLEGSFSRTLSWSLRHDHLLPLVSHSPILLLVEVLVGNALIGCGFACACGAIVMVMDAVLGHCIL